jgi:hypothetical protein
MQRVAYRIQNMASRKLLANPQGSRSNGTKIIQWDDTGGPEQAWSHEPAPGGGTKLRNMASGKVLANPQGSRDNGTEMIQWDDTGETDQEWTFDPPLGQGR